MILDTHIWFWWVNGDENKLSADLKSQIASADSLSISSVSCLEILWLEKKGKISLKLPPPDWIHEATISSQIECLPVIKDIAILAAILPSHHNDPLDRIIIATAIHHQIALMSFDEKFPSYLADGLILTK